MIQDGNFSELTAGTIQTSLYGQRPSIRGMEGNSGGGSQVPAYRNWLNWANADSTIEGVRVRAVLAVFGL